MQEYLDSARDFKPTPAISGYHADGDMYSVSSGFPGVVEIEKGNVMKRYLFMYPCPKITRLMAENNISFANDRYIGRCNGHLSIDRRFTRIRTCSYAYVLDFKNAFNSVGLNTILSDLGLPKFNIPILDLGVPICSVYSALFTEWLARKFRSIDIQSVCGVYLFVDDVVIYSKEVINERQVRDFIARNIPLKINESKSGPAYFNNDRVSHSIVAKKGLTTRMRFVVAGVPVFE